VKKHLGKKRLNASERRHLNHIQNTGTLVMNYGEPALKALAGRGVGWTNAKRILAEARDDDELCRLILEAERRYAKTKRFWKD
jgi:ATP-dependent Lhr-like helicase